MHTLFEASDTLNMPFECFIFDTETNAFPIRPHWHYFVEMIYILEGTAEMYDGADKYTVPKDAMILFHPKAIHSIFSANGEPVKYAVLKFDINRLSATPSYSPKLNSILKNAREKNMPICFDAKVCGHMECKDLFLKCVEELSQKNYGYDLLIQTYLYNLIMKIIRQWQCSGFSIENNLFHQNAPYDIDSITEYIDLHIKDCLQVNELAQKCGMSYSCFAKKFKSIYGVSCKTYIERFRIFKVEDFLLFTDFDLNYISQETGFSDCSHMIKNFKKYHDVTPKQFRLRNNSAM